MDLGLFKTLCFILHEPRPRALKQSQDLGLFKIKYLLLTMFLITFWDVHGLKTSHYVHEKKGFDSQIQKNTKISIFIKKIDLGLFKIGGYLDINLFKIGG